MNFLDDKIKKALEKGPRTRGQLVVEIKYPRTTIYDHLHALELAGEIVKEELSDGNIGRPLTVWRLKE